MYCNGFIFVFDSNGNVVGVCVNNAQSEVVKQSKEDGEEDSEKADIENLGVETEEIAESLKLFLKLKIIKIISVTFAI